MTDKITLESLDARLDKADARLDRIEADVGTLKSDVGTLKSNSETMNAQLIEHTVGLNRLERDMKDVVDHLEDFNLQQKSLTSAITEALTQLHLSRTYEKRIDRLETAVFGKPG